MSCGRGANPKSEIRNPKQIRIAGRKIEKQEDGNRRAKLQRRSAAKPQPKGRQTKRWGQKHIDRKIRDRKMDQEETTADPPSSNFGAAGSATSAEREAATQ